MLTYTRNLKAPSRILRSSMTEAEQVLWSRLRRKQLLGVQFYRQKPLARYIVDFYCAAASLVIEVGGSHLPHSFRTGSARLNWNRWDSG